MLDMVSELSEAMVEPLTFPAADRAVRDVLIEFGNRLAHTHSDSHLNALYRIALTEATRHPGIGRDFFERGPGRLTMCLAQYLEGSARRFNQLRIGDAKRVAENFLSLLGDILEFSDCTTATRTTSTNNHSKVVNEAVDLFCHGIVTGGQ
jgi:hypothetical protein